MKKLFLPLFTTSAICFILISCNKKLEPAPIVPVKSDRAESGINGTKLASFTTTDSSLVEFYQMESGEMLIRHSQVASDGSGPMSANLRHSSNIQNIFAASTSKNATLAEIYLAISNSPDKNVIDRLLAAQEKYAEHAAISKGEVIDSVSCILSAPITTQSRIEESCSPDYYNDYYGRDWFIRNFVNESLVRRYAVNVPSAVFKFKGGNWAKVCAMAADFSTKINFHGYYYLNGSSQSNLGWSMEVNPRRIETIYVRNFETTLMHSQATGVSPCLKVHTGLCMNGNFVYPSINYYWK